MTAKKTTESNVNGATIGIAVATIAAAAGAFFLYGSKDAKKNRKTVRGWVLKAKGEVLEKLETLKGEMNEENYNKIVDTVMKKYGSLKDTSISDVEEVVKELKGHWGNIKKHMNSGSKPKAKAKPKAANKPASK